MEPRWNNTDWGNRKTWSKTCHSDSLLSYVAPKQKIFDSYYHQNKNYIFRIVFWDVLRCKIIVRDYPWWWRQYVPLKCRLTIILHGSTSQKTILNFILAAVRTWNLTKNSICSAYFRKVGNIKFNQNLFALRYAITDTKLAGVHIHSWTAFKQWTDWNAFLQQLRLATLDYFIIIIIIIITRPVSKSKAVTAHYKMMTTDVKDCRRGLLKGNITAFPIKTQGNQRRCKRISGYWEFNKQNTASHSLVKTKTT
jgi:hypothetical protein